MEDRDIPADGPSDWQPMTNKADLAVISKLGEEVTECGSALFRCIIQGINEVHPVTGKINREWLEDEIAGVLGMVEHAILHFGLDRVRMAKRTKRKFDYKAPKFAALRARGGRG
jgi:hypothetical protein